MKKWVFAGVAAAALAAQAAPGTVKANSVTMTQDAVGAITVNYEIEGGPAIVTAAFEIDGAVVEDQVQHVVGDVNRKVSAKKHSFVWRADRDLPGRNLAAAKVKPIVKAWALDAPPDYMVLDCDVSSRAVRYFVSTNALPDGGLANDAYRSSRIVLRRIRAAGARYVMGSHPTAGRSNWAISAYENQHLVTLTNDFYIGIYELTQAQYQLLANDGLSYTVHAGTYPVRSVSYADMRGSVKWWPHDGRDVDADCWLDKARKAFGNEYLFDLPTEAQWEFATRAGTTGLRYSDAPVADIAYRGSGNAVKVGERQPNAWGLYDTLGNAWDGCRDQYLDYASLPGFASVVSPVGYADTQTGMFIARGGGFWDVEACCASAMRNGRDKTAKAADGYYGFRIAVDLVP